MTKRKLCDVPVNNGFLRHGDVFTIGSNPQEYVAYIPQGNRKQRRLMHKEARSAARQK